MAYENLLYEKRDGIGFITFNRPKVLNALNHKTMEELRGILLAARHDDEVRVLILTGAGEKSFVAGADISELAVQTPISGKETAAFGQGVLHLLETLGKPSIAAINGFAAWRRLRSGAGLLDAPGQQDCQAWPTRSEARYHDGLRRFAAPHSPVRQRRRACTKQCLTGEMISPE